MKVPSGTTKKKITPKQRQAVPLLGVGKSGKYVASVINVNPATVSQWINHDPDFRDALDEFSQGVQHLAKVHLETLTLDAIQELRYLLVHAKSEQVRLKAIELILTSVGIGGAVNGKKQESIEDLVVIDSGQFDLYKVIEAVTGE